MGPTMPKPKPHTPPWMVHAPRRVKAFFRYHRGTPAERRRWRLVLRYFKRFVGPPSPYRSTTDF